MASPEGSIQIEEFAGVSDEETTQAFSPPVAEPEAASEQPPAWFRRKQQREATQKPARPRSLWPTIIPDGDAEEQLPWSERLKRWFVSFAAAAYGISLLVHLVLLLLMSLYVIGGLMEGEAVTTLVNAVDEEPVQFEEIVDARLEMDDGELEEVLDAELQAAPLPSDAAAPDLNLDDSVLKLLGVEGGAKDDLLSSGGSAFAMPKSGKVVTKGSFTAWTVPEDPKPREDYLIVIQIRVPNKLQRYPLRDLSGRVVGTDGYRQQFPDRPNGHLAVREGITQFVVPVPGAARLVKDRIDIESKMLGERQELVIVF